MEGKDRFGPPPYNMWTRTSPAESVAVVLTCAGCTMQLPRAVEHTRADCAGRAVRPEGRVTNTLLQLCSQSCVLLSPGRAGFITQERASLCPYKARPARSLQTALNAKLCFCPGLPKVMQRLCSMRVLSASAGNANLEVNRNWRARVPPVPRGQKFPSREGKAEDLCC